LVPCGRFREFLLRKQTKEILQESLGFEKWFFIKIISIFVKGLWTVVNCCELLWQMSVIKCLKLSYFSETRLFCGQAWAAFRSFNFQLILVCERRSLVVHTSFFLPKSKICSHFFQKEVLES
jgi:hypothetical protein